MVPECQGHSVPMSFGFRSRFGPEYQSLGCDPFAPLDLHATLLHLLGIDHERLTFRFQGRDYRLTDVHGELVRGLMG